MDEFEVPMRLFAERAGIATFAVDYRLAPEAKFPVQVEEGEFFIKHLFQHASDYGVDPNKIAIGGDSAGGNMTCVLAQRQRDMNGPKLALQVPLFPECALPFDTLSGSENRTGLYLETAGILLFAFNVIPHDQDMRQPYISPLKAESVENLAPAILVTNGFDPLRDVGHAYAQRLGEAGNDLTYVHFPNLTHGFPQFTRYSKACHEATMKVADLIKSKIG